MNELNNGGTPAASMGDVESQWIQLGQRLAAQLSTMTDPDAQDHLILELPRIPGALATPYAQFAGFGEGHMIRAELTGNTYLQPAYELDDIACNSLRGIGWWGNDAVEPNWCLERTIEETDVVARMVVQALREFFGVPHPQLLTYQAWGPAAEFADQLGLRDSADVPVETNHEALSGIIQPDGYVELHAAVVDLVRERLGDDPSIDADGDIVLKHLGQPVWVHVLPDQPGLRIMARVAHRVHSRRGAAAELAILNRDNLWVKWNLIGRDVWQTLTIPAGPFVPAHLSGMLDVFFASMAETRDDLAYRIGARVA